MNKFEKKRFLAVTALVALCILTLFYIMVAPQSQFGSVLVVFCLVGGYLAYKYSKDMKRKSSEWEKKKVNPVKKRRRALLDRDRGKVLEFPSAGKNNKTTRQDNQDKTGR